MLQPSWKRRQPLGIALSTAACLALVASPTMAFETGGSGGGSAVTSDGTNIGQFFRNTLKCVKLQGKGESRREKAAEAFTKAFDEAQRKGLLVGKNSKTPSKNELKHLLAQILQETGGFAKLSEEKPSGHTNPQFKGRGFIQLTHKENYAKCVEFVNKTDRPGNINMILAGGETADKIIGDQADDLYLAAMCTISWWQDAKKVSDDFESALQKGSDGVDRVSEIVNAGPKSKVGAKTTENKKEASKKRYQEVEQCAR